MKSVLKKRNPAGLVGSIVGVALVLGLCASQRAVALPLQGGEPVWLLDVIPAGERYISAMVAGPGDTVYCGTSGRVAHIFIADVKGRKVSVFIDAIPGPITVNGCLALAPDGTVYAATMCDEAQLQERKQKNLPFDGGHIYRYRPSGGGYAREDLGLPVPGEGVYAILLDAGRGMLFGITYPSGKFFVFDLKSGQIADLRADVSGPLNSFETKLALCRALGQDVEGNVYFSGKEGHLYRYQPEQRNLEILPAQLPAVLGRYSYQSIDVLLRAPDGTFYGGDSDGYLFHFIPETGELENLGKVLRQHHIQSMTWGADGFIYGVGGEYDGMPRTFSYDPQRRVLHLGGIPTRLDPSAVWGQNPRMWQEMEPIACLVTTTSGAVVGGEFSRLGNLIVWEKPDE